MFQSKKSWLCLTIAGGILFFTFQSLFLSQNPLFSSKPICSENSHSSSFPQNEDERILLQEFTRSLLEDVEWEGEASSNRAFGISFSFGNPFIGSTISPSEQTKMEIEFNYHTRVHSPASNNNSSNHQTEETTDETFHRNHYCFHTEKVTFQPLLDYLISKQLPCLICLDFLARI